MELESILQKYSRTCNAVKVEMSDVMYNAIKEATLFVRNVTSMYNENEGYALGRSGLEKLMTEIKRFSAGSNVIVFKFLDKFKPTAPAPGRLRCTSCTIIICRPQSKPRWPLIIRTLTPW